ncbi:hypothetical protein [Spongiivirga citrea]|uniref:Uncharacterized protein n=1 Tax=Spongiivirga citrea TaxID=1481457 RepID=A0A6M0CK79_9FLAO|nr:hypothetical protein [Spongiivirga citrea]NER18335.1 hypothetical protein [Spongiivirga citrea]
MIDKKNGFIQFDKIVIPPGCSLNSVTALKFGSAYHIDDMETGWKWLRLAYIKIRDYHFRFSFGFFKDQLELVSFVFRSTLADENEGWDNFNEEGEKQKAITFNNWLTDQLGTQRDFLWGTIEASYDPRSASSGINIKYNKTHEQFGSVEAYEIEISDVSPQLESYITNLLKEHALIVKWTFAEYGAFNFYRDDVLLDEKAFSNELSGELYDHISRKLEISRHSDEISKGEGSVLVKDVLIFFKYQMTLESDLGIKRKSDTIKLS